MKYTSQIKTVTKFAVGAGVSTIVSTLVKAHVQPEKPVGKVLVFVGRVGLAVTISEIVEDHIDVKFDKIAKEVEHAINTIKGKN